MKFLKKSAALLALLLALFAPAATFSYAETENDSDIVLTVTASKATTGENKLTGSGTLVSAAVRNVFNFAAKETGAGKKKLALSYEINGKSETLNDFYFQYPCESPDDYGTMTVTVYERGGNEALAVFTVELRCDGSTGAFVNFLRELKRDLELNFVEGQRWKLLLSGLGNTLIITFCALILGILIGTVVAAVRSTYDKNRESYRLRGGFFYRLIRFLNGACNLYLTVIRGTPVVVQLLIMYFIIFAGGSNDLVVAILAFGINSGAYVAEILRGGIMAVDNGQFEAGRSLGFSYLQTMIHIVIPQMFKTALPALCNEFISLLKETSVAGYVPIIELTKAGNIIRSSTYTAFLPLIAVALIYLLMVVVLTKLVSLLERGLRKNER